MPNNNAWHDYKMQQIYKGFWLMYDNAEKAKHAANPLETLAEQSRKKAQAQEQAKQEALHPPKSSAEIALIEVMREVREKHSPK